MTPLLSTYTCWLDLMAYIITPGVSALCVVKWFLSEATNRYVPGDWWSLKCYIKIGFVAALHYVVNGGSSRSSQHVLQIEGRF